MPIPSNGARKAVRFDAFEVNFESGELRRNGNRVRIQDLPFRLLVALLERPGEVVSREQLRTQLWGDTVVDFDDGLSTAVRKLRDVLGDSATNPRFVETIPRRGYSFKAPVSFIADEQQEEAEPAPPAAPVAGPPAAPAGFPLPYAAFGALAIAAAALAVFAFVRFNRNATPVSGASDVVPITSYRGVQRSPALSPDGARVAFSWVGDAGDNLDVYVQRIDGTELTRLTTHAGADESPAWSPDGNTVAFVRGGWVFTVPAEGGAERKITTAAGHGLSWSADSRTIALSDWEAPGVSRAIFLASVHSAERRRLTSPAASKQDDIWPAFSPDGRHLAFIRRATTTTDVYRIPVSGGEATRVAIGGRPLRGLAWTPDGAHLLFATGKHSPGLLAVAADARDGRPERVDVAGSDVYEPSIVANAARGEVDLAYGHETSNWDIFGSPLPLGGSQPAPLAESGRADQAPAFSPDGQRLAFCSARSGYEEIWVSMADGSQPRQLTQFNSGLSSSPRWSPDGQWIAFDSTLHNNRDIYIVRAGGGSPERKTAEASSKGQPSWSGDGRWLYFMSDRSGSQQIWKMPVAGGAATQITRQGGYQAFESSDGRTLYYAKLQRGQGIWRTPVNGGPETLVPAPAWQNLWALSRDAIFFFDVAGAIPQVFDTPRDLPVKRLDLQTDEITTVTTIRTALPTGVRALEVRQDGRYLAWVGRRAYGSELMLIRNLRLRLK